MAIWFSMMEVYLKSSQITKKNISGIARLSQRNQDKNLNYTDLRSVYNLDVSKRRTKKLLSGLLKNKRTLTINEPI
jgi:hypothetical protein